MSAGSYISTDGDLGEPRCRHAWRDPSGAAYASVQLGSTRIVFGDPGLARQVAAACEAAAGKLDEMAAEARPVTGPRVDGRGAGMTRP